MCVCFALPVLVQCVTAEPVCIFQSDLHVFPEVGSWAGLLLLYLTHFSVDKLAKGCGARFRCHSN